MSRGAAATAAGAGMSFEIDEAGWRIEVRGRSSVVTCEILALGQALAVVFCLFRLLLAKHMNGAGCGAARETMSGEY
jgi:hypothetical protein